MKKIGGMMYPKKPRKTANKKYKCKKCGKELTPATAYFYIDPCNCAITENAPPYCLECYKTVYKY